MSLTQGVHGSQGTGSVPFKETGAKAMCWSCATLFEVVTLVDGYVWCGCGEPDIVLLRSARGAYRYGPNA